MYRFAEKSHGFFRIRVDDYRIISTTGPELIDFFSNILSKLFFERFCTLFGLITF